MAGGITFGTCKRKRAAWVRRATSNARSARQVGFPSRQYSVVFGWPRASADHRLHREVGGFGGRPQQIQQAGHQQPRAGAYERRAVFLAWGTGGLLRFLHACRRGVRHSNGYCNGSRGASRGVAGSRAGWMPFRGPLAACETAGSSGRKAINRGRSNTRFLCRGDRHRTSSAAGAQSRIVGTGRSAGGVESLSWHPDSVVERAGRVVTEKRTYFLSCRYQP